MRGLGRFRYAFYKTLVDASSADNYSLTTTDVVDSMARTNAGKIFAEPFGRTKLPFSISNLEYIAFCRFYLGLPPLITVGGATQEPGYDYKVQKCLGNHRGGCIFLDHSGCHAASGCTSTNQARCKKHTNVVMALAVAAQMAGLQVRSEPDTYSLLLNQFSKAECRRIFPKYATKAYDSKFDDLMETVLMTSDNKDISIQQQRSLLEEKIRALPAVANEDCTGLRLDLSVVDPTNGDTFWIDATVCHTTSPSYIRAECKAAIARQLSSTLADDHQLPDVKRFEPSPTLLQREKEKIAKYSRLTTIAAKQFRDGRRSKSPQFLPFALSDTGEYAPAALEFQEWLVSRFKKAQKRQVRADGVPLADLVRTYRRDLKIAVQFAIAAGVGSMMLAAGQPFQGLGSA